ncbi:alpha-glucosidase [Nostoc carneum NIES-2107]|nr:alpha-glucosidase [Nostoc carneum NIES-2107]
MKIPLMPILPLSAIHLEIDCQVGYRAFTIDPERFPQLASFTQELAELGVHWKRPTNGRKSTIDSPPLTT